MSTRNGHATRPRSSSLQDALHEIESDPKHHIAGSLAPLTPPTSVPGSPRRLAPHEQPSKGFLHDVITMRWMRKPSSSFKLLVGPIIMYLNWELIGSTPDNPLRRLLFVSNRLPNAPDGTPLYGKSYWDLAFIAYYIIVFSFIRQSLTIYFLKPLARHYGIHKESKLDRFAEQGYAVIYFTASGLLGLWTMYNYLPTWFYRTEYFWINYPHWQMAGTLKPYYLLQTAYWCQQFLLLVLRIEKPRSDFAELVAHHIVTLWLIGWSYLINLTLIGNAVYMTMDFSDIFLALSKCFNYLQMEKTKTVAFAWFTGVWTYTRHYLNLVMIWSVWTEFDLIPETSKQWNPETGAWLAPWMKYQIFIPLVLLQLINLFWYFLIWRIMLRAIFSSNLDDERSDDEDESAEPKNKKKSD
ncbi:longevity assurance proteins LAG1/LAC1 [Serendipita vermifera]|nr:longevity assurance proteins LAG1/LAC1 [Serendipita vermifera]